MLSYNGFNSKVLTMETTIDSDNIGSPVVLADGSVAEAAGADENFIGVCTAVRGSFCSVQMEGYVELAYTGTAPDYGFVNLVSNGEGGVKTAESTESTGMLRRVVKVDKTAKTVGFII